MTRFTDAARHARSPLPPPLLLRALQAIYKHNGETYMIRGLHSVEEVGVVRNVLTGE